MHDYFGHVTARKQGKELEVCSIIQRLNWNLQRMVSYTMVVKSIMALFNHVVESDQMSSNRLD